MLAFGPTGLCQSPFANNLSGALRSQIAPETLTWKAALSSKSTSSAHVFVADANRNVQVTQANWMHIALGMEALRWWLLKIENLPFTVSKEARKETDHL